MAKSRKQILQELLDLENEKVETLEEVEEKHAVNTNIMNTNPKTIHAVNSKVNDDDLTQHINENREISTSVEKVKKPRTPKQLEAFEKAKAIRDANALKRKEEAQRKAEEMRKKDEEKIIKKAIALKKKQLKQREIIDSISSDSDGDTPPPKPTKPVPLEKSRETKVSPTTPSLPAKPQIKISFF